MLVKVIPFQLFKKNFNENILKSKRKKPRLADKKKSCAILLHGTDILQSVQTKMIPSVGRRFQMIKVNEMFSIAMKIT